MWQASASSSRWWRRWCSAGSALSGGVGSLFGVALGVLILSFLANGLGMLNLATEWQLVVTGIIIIAAVAFDEMKRRR